MFEQISKYINIFFSTPALQDMEDWQKKIYGRVSQYTMTSPERVLATISAVEYIIKNDIPGAIVECGVWRGGNMMAAALVLQHFGVTRDIYLYDTFEGMTTPESIDIDFRGMQAGIYYAETRKSRDKTGWCDASLDEVRKNMAKTGYPESSIYFIKGDVETTLYESVPLEIAFLRLDTDWYKSTLCELEVLYPRVQSLGVVVIDDYGYWKGAKKAVDEYIAKNNIKCLLHRVDNTARQFVKI